MNYTLLIFVTIFIVTINMGCNKRTKTALVPQEVVITGQVINKPDYAPNSVAIIINDVATGGQIKFLDDLDDEGNFEIKFERYYPQEVMLKYFTIWSVFIHPGDSIHIELDFDKMNSDDTKYDALAFSGDAVAENQQLSVVNTWFIPLRKKESLSMMEEISLDPEAYRKYRDSLRNDYHQKANDLIENQKISEPIKTWIYYEIEHNYLHNLVNYPRLHRKRNNYPMNWDVPITYYDFFMETKFSSQFFVNSSFTFFFINDFSIFYIRGNIRKELTPKGLVKDTIYPNGKVAHRYLVKDMDSVFVDGINRFSPEEIKQYIYSHYFANKQRYTANTETYEKYLPLINKEITEPYLLSNLQQNHIENKELQKSPKNSRRKIFDAEDNLGTEVLKKIISDNKGKVIYLDCWATWCGPCIAEMPNSRNLMIELRDENVEFVFLCCNSPENAGKKKVEDLKLGGTHYFLSQDQTNYIQKELTFSAYPNYVLIDKQGEIVESSPVYSPGSERTKDKILELVNE